MTHRIVISSVFFILIISTGVLTGPGCANIVPPAGGFRDSLPPNLERVNPADSSVNFQGKKISFSFDEFVQLDNFSQNAILSPIPKLSPTANYRLNNVTVHLRDTLEANTTYTINFGESIKDVNEGNVMKGFTYVFSTGPAIDSLSFAGNVILAETGLTDTTLTVMLHKSSEDSAVVKDRPRYVTKLDNKGRFIFRNLPPGTFYVYALQDESRSYRYLDNKKLFAFADSPVVVAQNTSSKTLYAYHAAKASESSSSAAAGRPNAADKRLKYQTSVRANNQDLLQPFSFQFERPLRTFDSSRIRFSTDTSFTPVTGYSWSLDTTGKKVTLNFSFAEDTRYNLVLQKDFATDTLGHQLLRADTIRFNTLKSSDYGKLSIRFRNLDLSKNPVVQFVQSGSVVSSYPLTAETFSQPLFLPGEYELRILFDANKNGIWDTGRFFGKHIQPELVKPVLRKSINVKENWENEFEINL
jgi:hypothetical protein